MSLAQLFYLKETFRKNLRRGWRSKVASSKLQGSRSHLAPQPDTRNFFPRSASHFTLESFEPRVLLSASPTEVSVSQPL